MRRSTNIRRALHRAQLGKLLGAWLWTWMKLTEQLNFCGCELLIVDAEGHDTAVLCSMLAHCKERLRNGLYEWPNVVLVIPCITLPISVLFAKRVPRRLSQGWQPLARITTELIVFFQNSQVLGLPEF